MPTGYTAKISEGISFEDFVLQCARAFGATITMRDDSLDAPIPDEFKPSDYHPKALKMALEELARLKSLSREEIIEQSEKDYANKCIRWEQREVERLELKNKYKAMLAKVIQWKPPTTDHQGLKDFMLQQIRDSIEWDCLQDDKPKKLSPEEWQEKAIETAQWNVEYHQKEGRKEIQRAKERTEWVRELKKSLNSNPAVA
jgi:hypothetical protein